MKLNKLLLFMNEFACVRAIIFAGVYNRVRLYVRVRMCAFVCVCVSCDIHAIKISVG